MHLKCECLIQNRNVKLSDSCYGGQQTKKKPTHSFVSIGMEKDTKKVFFKISTAANKELFLSNVFGNIEQVFDKFIKDGKLTIRVKQPEVDLLFSKADPVALSAFAKILKSTSDGVEIDKKIILSTKKSILTKDFVKPPTILAISERKFYPFASPIPQSLEVLQTTNCKLTQFDVRILKLRNLKSLDLSNNCMKMFLNQMNFASHKNLIELKLNSNDFDELPNEFWLGLPPNLRRLHLNHNRLTTLPDIVWKQKFLHTLDVSFNLLDEISWRIGNLRQNLKHLNVSNNNLTELPSCLLKFNLDYVDLSSNPYRSTSNDEGFYEGECFGDVDSLQNLAFKIILENKLPTLSLPPGLRNQAENVVRNCATCSKTCLVSSSRMTTMIIDVKHIASHFVFLQGQRFQTVPLVGFCCSTNCFDHFTKNRFKTKTPIRF